MASPTAPTQYTLIPGPSTPDPAQGALVVADGNGGLASIVTPWLLNSSGIYIPWPVSAGGHPQVDVTGSLPAGTAQLGTVGLTGNLAPLTAGSWVDIVTMTAAQMPAASATIYPSYANVLHANARQRFFRLANSLNESWSVSFWVTSSIGTSNTSSYGAMGLQTVTTNAGNLYFGSRALPNLGEAGTAIQMQVGSGSTVAATGQWTLSVKEVF